MQSINRRTLLAVTALAAGALPASANGKLALDPGAGPPPATASVAPRTAPATADRSSGVDWADAGLGAGIAVGAIAAGAGVVVVRRRRVSRLGEPVRSAS